MLARKTPLKRGKPLARKTALKNTGGLKRGGRLPQKRKGGPRRGRELDAGHLSFVRSLPCCAPGCKAKGPRIAHHNTFGRGLGQKSDDSQAMALHDVCHRDFHALAGAFKGWSQAMLRLWQKTQVDLVLAEEAIREANALLEELA
jgi:hypothetical protein